MPPTRRSRPAARGTDELELTIRNRTRGPHHHPADACPPPADRAAERARSAPRPTPPSSSPARRATGGR